ncbi:hypothetical protein SAMN05216276_102842 [Streptosporangium subroseum]|uniref:Uncharacterized protein n=1 Tax=Streptosporangium subroseum TaxID=106412 RepID=A0A239KQS5_9ACTN|nr:hypothetical protein SAMN05216276_102842 [Streptosporangium subroseum]
MIRLGQRRTVAATGMLAAIGLVVVGVGDFTEWIGDHASVLRALLLVVVLQGVALLIAGATRK